MGLTNPNVRVGKVPYGKGVFAARDLEPGELLGQVEGDVKRDPDYSSTYCIDLGDNTSLEPKGSFRYLNHCCTPNCQLFLQPVEYEDGTPAQTEVHVEVLRPLKKGQELTIDYGWSADGAIPCLCGATNCRGWIVDPAEVTRLNKMIKKGEKGPVETLVLARKTS